MSSEGPRNSIEQDKVVVDKDNLHQYVRFLKDSFPGISANKISDIANISRTRVHDLLYNKRAKMISREEVASLFQVYDYVKGGKSVFKPRVKLTREEEIDLVNRAKAGDQEALARMVKANRGMVVNQAKWYKRFGMQFEDLRQEGDVGMLRAIERWNPDLGYGFYTYGVFWVRQRMSRAISDQARTVRLPVHMGERLRAYRRFRNYCNRVYGRLPTSEEVSAKLDISPDLTKEIAEISAQEFVDVESIEEGELIDDNSPDEDEMIEMLDIKHGSEVLNLLDVLTPRQRRVMEARVFEGMTLEAIAQDFYVTRERIRQIESKAIGKMRKKAFYQGIPEAVEAGLEDKEDSRKVQSKPNKGPKPEGLQLDKNNLRQWMVFLRNSFPVLTNALVAKFTGISPSRMGVLLSRSSQGGKYIREHEAVALMDLYEDLKEGRKVIPAVKKVVKKDVREPLDKENLRQLVDYLRSTFSGITIKGYAEQAGLSQNRLTNFLNSETSLYFRPEDADGLWKAWMEIERDEGLDPRYNSRRNSEPLDKENLRQLVDHIKSAYPGVTIKSLSQRAGMRPNRLPSLLYNKGSLFYSPEEAEALWKAWHDLDEAKPSTDSAIHEVGPAHEKGFSYAKMVQLAAVMGLQGSD